MNKEEQQGKSIYYNVDDKHFWAAFLNLARHNVFITVNHINERLGIKPMANDEDVLTICKTWMANDVINRLEKKEKLHSLILKHFPFLVPAAYGETKHESSKKKAKNSDIQAEALSFERITKMLFTFLEELHLLRNYYSHYEHPMQKEKPTFEENFFHRLYDVFDASVNLVKGDHKHNPKINPHNDFIHLIRKGKGGNDSPKFKHKFQNSGVYTEAGLLFFVSLFLDKKDAIWMQKKIFGFKAGDKGYKRMTNEVFCRNRMLIPKLRLESEYDNDQMLLDILNELTRCPKPLYDRLREEDRDKFRVPIEEYLDEEEDENEDPFKNTLIRHENRFPYFALRYFDLKEVFSELRFQVDLGTYHFSIYDKKIGEQLEKRHLTRNLYGFDRIQSFDEKNQPEEWKKLVKDLDYYESSDLPFISKTTPHYHLSENKIGIKFIEDTTKKWLDLKVENNDGKKKYRYDKDFVADAFLSVHELTPMLFYYILTRDGKKVEGVIKGIIENIFEIYDDFGNGKLNSISDLETKLAGKDILLGHLPKQMISILANKEKDMEKEAIRKQNELKEETNKKLERVNRQEKEKIKFGKRKSGLMKPGVIADWLVKDMMRFQPVAYDSNGNPLNRSKANSTEYQMLQRAFALYGSEKSRLPGYFEQLNLIGSQNPHPFLSKFKLENQTNILSFYKAYLKARLEYIESLNPSEWRKNQHFLLLKEPKTNRNTLVTGWKNGFNLPRGIFTEPIRDWLKNRDNYSAIRDKVTDFEKPGFITKTIPLYFREIEQDDVPEYYSYVVNIANPDKPQKGELKALDHKAWQNFEKQLRQLKSQDMLLWLICKEMLQMKELVISDFKLKKINISEGSILNKEMRMMLPVPIYPANEKGYVDKKAEPISLFYIVELSTKVRKQGNFKALVKDRRLNGLFSYAKRDGLDTRQYPIAKTVLEHELSKYQTARVEIFEIMLTIEKNLAAKYPDLPKDKFSNMMNEWLDKQANKEELKKSVNTLIAIRNAFAHNQYPMYNEEYFGTDIRFSLMSLNEKSEKTDEPKISATGVACKLVEITEELSKIIN